MIFTNYQFILKSYGHELQMLRCFSLSSYTFVAYCFLGSVVELKTLPDKRTVVLLLMEPILCMSVGDKVKQNIRALRRPDFSTTICQKDTGCIATGVENCLLNQPTLQLLSKNYVFNYNVGYLFGKTIENLT